MIHHFYHIYADGQWSQPVEEHIRALEVSGLGKELVNRISFDVAETIKKPCTFHIGIVGTPENRSQVKTWLSQRVQYNICAEADSGWEQVTQIPMWEYSKTHEGLILYAHTKGAYSGIDVNVRWRRSMIYWNVIRWQDAVEQLKTHGAVGCHWIQPLISMPEHTKGNWMFAGTFFWTHCNLMRTWNKPALTHRHEAEGFIGYGWHESNFPVYDFTPYFPNTGPFADGWVNDPNFIPEQHEHKSYQ